VKDIESSGCLFSEARLMRLEDNRKRLVLTFGLENLI
jgi:hypothetical protein